MDAFVFSRASTSHVKTPVVLETLLFRGQKGLSLQRTLFNTASYHWEYAIGLRRDAYCRLEAKQS